MLRWRIGQIPLQRLSGPGIVINIQEKARTNRDALMTLEDVKKWEDEHGKIPENSIVLLNSGMMMGPAVIASVSGLEISDFPPPETVQGL